MESINFLKTSQISIITKSEVRYEGTLYNINAQEKKITLSNVRSFGTEGRRQGNDLPAFGHVYDHIVFSSDDIKDLTVLQNPNEIPAQPQQGNQVPSEVQEPKEVVQQPEEVKPQATQQATVKPASTPVQRSNAPQTNAEANASSDFDFEANIEGFKKLHLEGESAHQEKKYNKTSSFFDTISNSTTEKTRETKEERYHQTQIDKETFGNSEYNQYRVKQNNWRGNSGYRGDYRNSSNRPNTGGYNNNGRGHYKNYNKSYGMQKYGGGQRYTNYNSGANAGNNEGGEASYAGPKESTGYNAAGERPYSGYGGGYSRGGGQNKRFHNNKRNY